MRFGSIIVAFRVSMMSNADQTRRAAHGQYFMKLWSLVHARETPYSDLKSCCRIPQDFSSSRHADLDTGIQQACFSSEAMSRMEFILSTRMSGRARSTGTYRIKS
jgi:hypothetical protein